MFDSDLLAAELAVIVAGLFFGEPGAGGGDEISGNTSDCTELQL